MVIKCSYKVPSIMSLIKVSILTNYGAHSSPHAKRLFIHAFHREANFSIIFSILCTGASTIKWTTLDPFLCLSESDPKLYTNFKFYGIEIHKHLENI